MNESWTKMLDAGEQPARHPAPPVDGITELRCTEKGNQVIAAERCAQSLDCPRARTCALRPIAEATAQAAHRGDANEPTEQKPRAGRASANGRLRCAACGQLLSTRSSSNLCRLCRGDR